LPLEGIFILSERSASNLLSKIRGSIETEGIRGVKQHILFETSVVSSFFCLEPFFLFFLSSAAYVAITALLTIVAVILWDNYSRSVSGLVSG